MSHKITTMLIASALLLSLSIPVSADGPVADGLAWLKTQQQPDGGFTNGFAEGSDLGTTCDIVLAAAAGEQDVHAWVSDDGNSPLDYLGDQLAAGAVDQLGLRAKVALALLASGEDPETFEGHTLIAELQAAYGEATGSYSGNIFEQAMVML